MDNQLLPNAITADHASNSFSHFADFLSIPIPSDLTFDPAKLPAVPATVTTIFFSEDSEP
jgi:hypothetical protein